MREGAAEGLWLQHGLNFTGGLIACHRNTLNPGTPLAKMISMGNLKDWKSLIIFLDVLFGL